MLFGWRLLGRRKWYSAHLCVGAFPSVVPFLGWRPLLFGWSHTAESKPMKQSSKTVYNNMQIINLLAWILVSFPLRLWVYHVTCNQPGGQCSTTFELEASHELAPRSFSSSAQSFGCKRLYLQVRGERPADSATVLDGKGRSLEGSMSGVRIRICSALFRQTSLNHSARKISPERFSVAQTWSKHTQTHQAEVFHPSQNR